MLSTTFEISISTAPIDQERIRRKKRDRRPMTSTNTSFALDFWTIEPSIVFTPVPYSRQLDTKTAGVNWDAVPEGR